MHFLLIYDVGCPTEACLMSCWGGEGCTPLNLGAERRMQGREMLPMLAVGWRASALRGEEAGSWHVHHCCGRSAFLVDTSTVDSRVA